MFWFPAVLASYAALIAYESSDSFAISGIVLASTALFGILSLDFLFAETDKTQPEEDYDSDTEYFVNGAVL